MSPIVDVVAGWRLPDGVIDSVDPFEAARHLPLIAEHRLTGVAHAAMLAGDLEVDDPDRVAEAHRQAMARSLLLEDVLLDALAMITVPAPNHALSSRKSASRNDVPNTGDRIARSASATSLDRETRSYRL